MSYHRRDRSGAVAVSFSTSTMSPLSPNRSFSGSSGSGTSVTSGTNGSATSKYSNYHTSTSSNLVNDRNTDYYSSASNTRYRSSGYASSASSDVFKRNYCSPVRSVSSYNESSSIVGSSSLSGNSLKYGSASSSSASSSAGSSCSSLTSRDRNSLSHHTAGSLATTAADLYAQYSPIHYVPNIHGTASKISNNTNYRRPSSSSYGISGNYSSSSRLIDDYDNCRERREPSYSSESSSSGTGISSNNSVTSSNNQNSHSPSNERWTTRREVNKRRPVVGSSSSSSIGTFGIESSSRIAGNANKTNVGSSKIEVNLEITEETSLNSCENCNNDLSIVETNVLSKVEKNNDNVEILPHEKNNDTSRINLIGETIENFVCPVINDFDNNNTATKCKILTETRKTNVKSDVIVAKDSTSETRRRRRRPNVDSTTKNLTSNDQKNLRRNVNKDTDENGERNVNLTNLDSNDIDTRDEANDTKRNVAEADASKSLPVKDHNHHHQRKRQSDKTSINDFNNRDNEANIPALSSISDNSLNNDTIITSVASLSSSLSSLPIFPFSEITSNHTNSSDTSLTDRKHVTERKEAILNSSTAITSCPRLSDIEETGNIGNLNISVDSYDCDVNNVSGGDGGGSGGGVVVAVAVDSSPQADNNRKALTRTKITTNNDNTELLTNNNVQDREDNLGIVEKTRKNGNDIRHVMVNDEMPKTKNNERHNVKGTRKILLWTATNEIDDDEKVSSVDDKLLTNGDEKNTCDNTNGFDKFIGHDETKNLRIHDVVRDENFEESSLTINGVESMGNHSDDMEKTSASRRTLFGWNDPTIDDLTGASSSSSSSTSTSSSSTASSSSSSSSTSTSAAGASSSNSTNSVPVAVHQNLYRGLNEQIDESSNSRPPRSRLHSRRDERYGLNGLRNIGNTCFMNSVIQCLSNTRPLLEYLLNEQHLHDINTTTSGMKGALIKAFGQVIQELWEMSGDHVINTTALKSQIQRFAPRFMGYSQQDAQEFLRYLLEGLHEDVNRVTVKPQPILTDIPDHYSDSHKASESWKRYLRSEDSTIVDVFVGQLRSSLHCTACDHVSVTLDPFWDLSLPIPLRLGTVKLNQCLEHFTKVETLDGDEKPTCSKCQMRRKCTKSFSIQKFPKILVIHLKRFSPTERFRGKLSVLVDFPLACLDLSAFAAPGVQGCTYNLYGVANHSGTTYSGHYTAYCKHPYSGEWHEYNDSRVSTVSGRSVVSSEAYVLFYEQQPPSPHL